MSGSTQQAKDKMGNILIVVGTRETRSSPSDLGVLCWRRRGIHCLRSPFRITRAHGHASKESNSCFQTICIYYARTRIYVYGWDVPRHWARSLMTAGPWQVLSDLSSTTNGCQGVRQVSSKSLWNVQQNESCNALYCYPQQPRNARYTCWSFPRTQLCWRSLLWPANAYTEVLRILPLSTMRQPNYLFLDPTKSPAIWIINFICCQLL